MSGELGATIALMATMRERQEAVQRTLESIYPQFDRIRISLNGYDEVPRWAFDSKLSCTLNSDDREGGNSVWRLMDDADGIIFVMDDYILYPADYRATLVEKLEEYNRRAVVGVHGMLFKRPFFDYTLDRRMFHFPNALSADRRVHALGVGTTAFFTSAFKPTIGEFPDASFRDAWFAIKALKEHVPMVCVARPAGWTGRQAGVELSMKALNQKEFRAKLNTLVQEALLPAIPRRPLPPRSKKVFAVSEHERRVTCLLPLKNFHPGYLEQAMNSIRTQSDPNWRLLVIVENGDLIDFRSLLETWLVDPRVKIVGNEGRRMGGALNTGMRVADTSFVAILMADDLWSEDAIETLNEYIKHNPEVDFFHSSRFVIDESGRRISSIHSSRKTFKLEDFHNTSPVKHLLCWRREKALQIGGVDEALDHGADDYDFPWSMAEAGCVFKSIKRPLYIYRDHRECYRLTTHVPKSRQKWALRRILKKHGIAPEAIRARIAAVEGSYLRQCLFETPADQREKEKGGFDVKGSWKEKYR